MFIVMSFCNILTISPSYYQNLNGLTNPHDHHVKELPADRLQECMEV